MGRYAALLYRIIQFIRWNMLLFVIHIFLADIAEFIQLSLEKNCHKDVLPALLNELNVPHLLHSRSQEELSAGLQAMVKERRMSCFHFAQLLLRSKTSRPFIFEFAAQTGESLEWELHNCGALSSAFFCSALYSSNSFCIPGRFEEAPWEGMVSTGQRNESGENRY